MTNLLWKLGILKMTKLACYTLTPRNHTTYDPQADDGYGGFTVIGVDDVWRMPDENDHDDDMESFCNCCGARYIEETTDKTRAYSKWGIDLYAGHVGKEGVHNGRTKDVHVTHINTKAGPLTAAIWTK